MHFFLGSIPQGIHPSQHRTALPSVIVSGLSQAGEGCKAAKRLGDFLQTEWGLRLCQSQGVRVHHPLFLYPPPKSFPESLFVTMLVLGHLSLVESYPSWANQSPAWGQPGWSKRGKRLQPCQEDKLCLLSGLWSQGLWLSLSHGGFTASETRQGFSQH